MILPLKHRNTEDSKFIRGRFEYNVCHAAGIYTPFYRKLFKLDLRIDPFGVTNREREFRYLFEILISVSQWQLSLHLKKKFKKRL